MKRLWNRTYLSIAAVLIVAGVTVSLLTRAIAEGKRQAQEQPKLPPPANVGPAAGPNAAPAPNLRDFGKGVIELTTKQILAARTIPAAAPAGPALANPKVQPGNVRWHKDFAAARAAAGKSGKPVLLFQMMGNLDERFC
jgi:hypothetical protein